jgi:hypothetical protein
MISRISTRVLGVYRGIAGAGNPDNEGWADENKPEVVLLLREA